MTTYEILLAAREMMETKPNLPFDRLEAHKVLLWIEEEFFVEILAQVTSRKGVRI